MRKAALLLLLTCALAGCNRGPAAKSIDALDQELLNAGGDADPALTGALADQIMVDPQLAQQANAKTVKPAPAPVQAPIPPGEDEKAQPPAGGTPPPVAVAGVRTGDCRDMAASPDWAARLPAAFPVMPGARIAEAAGSASRGCTLRIVSFTSPEPVERVIAFYAGKARAAGYSVARDAANGEVVLGGTRGDAAYTVMLRPRAGGTEADLVVNGGI